MKNTDKELVAKYLKLKATRRLRKIRFTGKLNFNLFALAVALIAVLPMIPCDNQANFTFKTTDLFHIKYDLVLTIYFIFLILLLLYNILMAIINISRKIKYGNLMQEIDNLNSFEL